MSNKKTTREQFKEMVTYLMEEGTDNSIIEGYTDTFMLIHNESQQPEHMSNKIEEAAREYLKSQNISDNTIKFNQIFSGKFIQKTTKTSSLLADFHNSQSTALESKVKELEEEKDKWLSMYYEASTSLDLQAEKLIENKKRIEAITIGKNQNT